MIAGSAQAAIQVAGTRIVFDGAQKEQTVRLTNTDDAPILAQLWLDSGKEDTDGQVRAGAEKTPFILNPPVARINGKKSQVIRIFKTADVASLPTDRESIFYFNALEVPAKPKSKATSEEGGSSNRLNIALRTRLKMFYRPAGLKGDVISAAEGLKWSVRRDGKDYVVTCTNGSPVHVSFAKLVLQQGDAKTELAGGMAGPMGDAEFRFQDAAAGQGPLTLNFDYISDLGAFVPGTATLQVRG